MKVNSSGKYPDAFPVHPEGKFSGVCVKCTEPKTKRNELGEYEAFRIIFKTDRLTDSGRPITIASRPLVPSLRTGSHLRSFLEEWFGRSLTDEEEEELETDDLIGRSASLSIVHVQAGGKTYANIDSIAPDTSGIILKPSEHDGRAQDRSDDTPKSSWREVQVHVGPTSGKLLGELPREEVQALLQYWLPSARRMDRTPTDDELLGALPHAARELGIG